MPETAAVTGKTTPLTGHADVLAGESAVDKVNSVGVVSPPSRCSKPFSFGARSDSDHVSASSLKCGRVHFANVVNALHLRPVPREHRQTPGIVFHLQHRLDASPLQPLLETRRPH
jgi:hypothetical protein